MPVAPLYEPAGQARQAVEADLPVAPLYEPAGQEVGVVMQFKLHAAHASKGQPVFMSSK